MPNLKHAELIKIGDVLFVMDLLSEMNGKDKFMMASAIVNGLRKRMRDRYREDLRMARISKDRQSPDHS